MRIPRRNSTIWSEMIEIGKQHLRHKQNTELALEAAEYFFLQPIRGDENDMTTFTGLMTVNEINPDEAAKAIFNDLPMVDQRRICLLLRDAGYEVHPTHLGTDEFID